MQGRDNKVRSWYHTSVSELQSAIETCDLHECTLRAWHESETVLCDGESCRLHLHV